MSDERDEASRIHEVAANMKEMAAGRGTSTSPSALRATISERSTTTTSSVRSRAGRPAGARTCAARSTRSPRTACAPSSEDWSARFPTSTMEVISTTSEGERCGVHWRARGTFAGEDYNGIAPTGSRLDLEGFDLLTVREG